jgi:hypothetical protein
MKKENMPKFPMSKNLAMRSSKCSVNHVVIPEESFLI